MPPRQRGVRVVFAKAETNLDFEAEEPHAEAPRSDRPLRPPTPINPISQRIVAALRKKHPMD